MNITSATHPALFGKHVLCGSDLPEGIDIQVFDPNGNDVTSAKRIKAGFHRVKARWIGVSKRQKVALRPGLVTEAEYNAKDKDGNPCFEFQGNGWRPQAKAGAVIVYDVTNPGDTWSLDSVSNVNESGYEITGEFLKDGRPVFWKSVAKSKVQAGFVLPAGWTIESLEGEYVSEGGELLVCNKAARGDFFMWLLPLVNSPAVIRL